MPRFAAPQDSLRAMPKTARLLLFPTLAAVAADVWYCALAEATVPERVFALCLHAFTAATVAFATARPVFALFLGTWIFGTIWCSGAIKFTYLEVPAIAPDLQYFANADTLALFGRYPPILAAFFALLVFCPLMLIWAWRRDPSRPGWRRPLGALVSGAALGATVWPGGPFASLYDKPMWVAVNDESFITDFVTSFHDTQIHVPRPAAPSPPVSWPAAPPSAAMTDMQGATARQSQRPQTAHTSTDSGAVRRAMIRFSNAYGTCSLGGDAFATAINFCWSFSKSITGGADETLFRMVTNTSPA
jgi:hypothetical protein